MITKRTSTFLIPIIIIILFLGSSFYLLTVYQITRRRTYVLEVSSNEEFQTDQDINIIELVGSSRIVGSYDKPIYVRVLADHSSRDLVVGETYYIQLEGQSLFYREPPYWIITEYGGQVSEIESP